MPLGSAAHDSADPSSIFDAPRSTPEIVENFMSSWSRLIGDPLLSKWIVMGLATSVSFTGYFLRGVAAGLGWATFTLDGVSRVLRACRLARGSFFRVASSSSSSDNDGNDEVVRSFEKCIDIFESPRPVSIALSLSNDEELILLTPNDNKALANTEYETIVTIPRALIASQFLLSSIARPLGVDGHLFPIPIATAERILVISTSRGCKALNAGGEVITVLTQDAINFPTIIDFEKSYSIVKEAVELISQFAILRSLKCTMIGRALLVRFTAVTEDTMGMNMRYKGTEDALEIIQQHFPDMITLALSGNYCTNKKPAVINWIGDRVKKVDAEAVILGKFVKSVLETTMGALRNLNMVKNLIGSAMTGYIDDFNAHAANILMAIFVATGQGSAQNVENSNRMTHMKPTNNDEDLLITVSMPSIEVDTIGGTVLAPQQAILEMLRLKSAHPTQPGQNAQALACLIAAAVMAGELSLVSALAAGHLVRAHLVHNRSRLDTPAASTPVTPGGPFRIETGGVFGIKARELGMTALTPSASTGSLPPCSLEKP
ncbi:hydroxymethylglutaryl-coenzyme A reductase-domain-containing protein [Lentinula edodes]|nr:hydroxymethylglutaryl-coenzyme A reductase-domain-containing protein [Lentinula edodes]